MRPSRHASGTGRAPSSSEHLIRAATTGLGFESVDLGDGAIPDSQPIDVEGPFTEDGTLVKPVAVDTTVPDGRDLVKTYTVKVR